MCYFNRLTRVACWLADYPEWLQFCWDFVKPPRNDEIALQHFSISFVLHAIFFFQQALAGNCFSKITSNKRLQEIVFQKFDVWCNRSTSCFTIIKDQRPSSYCISSKSLKFQRQAHYCFLITHLLSSL